MIVITTLNKIRSHDPCRDGWEKLLRGLGKTRADDEPLNIATIIDINGLDDALWCLRAVEGHDREIRLYAVWCARRVEHLMTDPRSVAVLDVAERYARGEVSDEELRAAACAAVWAAAWTMAAAACAAEAAACAAVWAAEWAVEAAAAAMRSAAVGDTERAAQAAELRRICGEAKP